MPNREIIHTHIIPAGHGYSLIVEKGHTLRITDLEGLQVTDLLMFDSRNYDHRFSRAQTKKLNAKIWVSTGDLLYSNRCDPLMIIAQDMVGTHDMQFSPCGPEDNLLRFKKVAPRTCMQNFQEALEKYKIPSDHMTEPFGIFFNMKIDEEGELPNSTPNL